MKQTFQDSVWRVRDFRKLALGRSIASAGVGLVTIVQLLRLVAHGGGSEVIMLLLLADSLPPILLAGIIGQIADRRDSRVVLAVGITGQVLACLILATTPRLTVTCLAMATLSAGAALSSPVWMVLVPVVVGEERIGAAIGGQQAMTATLAPLGAGAGGLLFSGVGSGIAMLVSAICFVQLLVVAMRLGARRAAQTISVAQPAVRITARLRRSLLPDLSLLRRDRFVWRLILSVVPLVVVVQGINVLEVSLARTDIGISAALYGWSEILVGAGTVVGAFVAGRMAGPRFRGWAIVGGLSAVASAIAALGATYTVLMYFALLAVIGLGSGLSNACFGALFIERTPVTQRGRVSASVNGLMQTAAISSLGLGGLFGALIGVRASFIAAGCAGLAVLAVSAVLLPRTPTTLPTVTPSPTLTPTH